MSVYAPWGTLYGCVLHGRCYPWASIKKSDSLFSKEILRNTTTDMIVGKDITHKSENSQFPTIFILLNFFVDCLSFPWKYSNFLSSSNFGANRNHTIQKNFTIQGLSKGLAQF